MCTRNQSSVSKCILVIIHHGCHKMTARAARLEQGFPVTLKWIGYVGLRGRPVSQRDAVSAVATLPRMKGQKGFVRVGAWWSLGRIEVFHSIRRCCASYRVVAGRGIEVVLGRRS